MLAGIPHSISKAICPALKGVGCAPHLVVGWGHAPETSLACSRARGRHVGAAVAGRRRRAECRRPRWHRSLGSGASTTCANHRHHTRNHRRTPCHVRAPRPMGRPRARYNANHCGASPAMCGVGRRVARCNWPATPRRAPPCPSVRIRDAAKCAPLAQTIGTPITSVHALPLWRGVCATRGPHARCDVAHTPLCRHPPLASATLPS